jgi:uncharacterized protein DUF6600/FecR-like protein
MRHSKHLTSLLAAIAAFLTLSAMSASLANAGQSHARIIRLSLVQGDVRFTPSAHGDPLADSKAIWETAVLNLPVREGYVLATDNGRAEIEFENGTMAFLNENTVLEFYDLSLEDGARTTRLVLRQGAASFYVSGASGDYFSVTGGDFTAEATSRANFRLDNFDDGSVVNVLGGRISVVRKNHTTDLVKGQSLSMSADEATAEHVGRATDSDDFDRWVSGREDTVVTATEAGMQYASNDPSYVSGYGDLYTYGTWQNLGGGYGYGWQPFGAGPGWCPFDNGFWFQDSAFGWGFIGNQPWGWLPYHYGGWIYRPGLGWVWTPGRTGTGLAGGIGWRAATVNWVHANNGTVGVVPSNPGDVKGKAPVNLTHGVFPITNGAISHETVSALSNEWKTEKTPPRNALTGALAVASRPELVSRTTLAGGSGNRIVTIGPDSSITYDRLEHRFVNSNAPRVGAAGAASSEGRNPSADHLSAAERRDAALGVTSDTARAGRPVASTGAAAARRNESVAARHTPTPAPSVSARSSGGEVWGGRTNSGGSTGSSHPSASASASAHPSAAPAASSGRAH